MIKDNLSNFKARMARGLPIVMAILCLWFVSAGCEHGARENASGARAHLEAYTPDKCPIETMAFRDANGDDWCRQKIENPDQWGFLGDDSMQGVERLKTVFQPAMTEEQATEFEAGLPEPPGDLKFRSFLIQFSDLETGIVAHILGADKLVRLKHLHLRLSFIDDREAKAIANAKELPQLQTLDLSNNFITANGVHALTASRQAEGITTLNLAENAFEDAGAIALAAAKELKKLKTLHLYYCGIGDTGAAAIAAADAFQNLETLDLSENNITAVGINAISESKNLKKLKKLMISRNPANKKDVQQAVNLLKKRGVEVVF